jgi:hypothetical protein
MVPGLGTGLTYAPTDAIVHLTRALTLLAELPATPERIQQELILQATLGPALMAIKGFAAPEVAHALPGHTRCASRWARRPSSLPCC